MIWNRHFAVVGMSFECRIDKALMLALANTGDDLPIGESKWIVLNPDRFAARQARKNIPRLLPYSKVTVAQRGFGEWIAGGMPELRDWGVFAS